MHRFEVIFWEKGKKKVLKGIKLTDLRFLESLLLTSVLTFSEAVLFFGDSSCGVRGGPVNKVTGYKRNTFTPT